MSFSNKGTGSASTKTTGTNGSGNGSGNGVGLGLGIFFFVIVLILLFGYWGTCTESGKATFANIKTGITTKLPSLANHGQDLRELDIVMFMNPTCPWCKKMLGVLDSQLKNITVVDMTKPEGIAMAQQFGADKQPVPSFISRKNKVGTIGYRDSVAKLINDLKMPAQPSEPSSSDEPISSPGQIDINLIKSLQIVLFARDNCPWCMKAKESCAQSGVMDVIQVVDITTPQGQSMASEMLPPGTSGVPAWISVKTGKHVVGFKPIDQIVQALYSGNVPNEMA